MAERLASYSCSSPQWWNCFGRSSLLFKRRHLPKPLRVAAISTRASSCLLESDGPLARRSAVRQHQRLAGADSPGGNRRIALAQATKHFELFAAGHNPEDTTGAIEHRKGERHATPALIDSR